MEEMNVRSIRLGFFLEILMLFSMFISNYRYRKIPNISPVLIGVHKHFWGGLYLEGLIFGWLIFEGHFVLESEYQDLKIHRYISLL